MRAGVRFAYLNNRLNRGCQSRLRNDASTRDTHGIGKHIKACVLWDYQRTILHSIVWHIPNGHQATQDSATWFDLSNEKS